MHGHLKISLQKIQSNWLALNHASNGKASAVIKANSYGLGMVKVAKSLIDVGCQFFYVANINEAIDTVASASNQLAIFGANQTWDFSNLLEQEITTIIWL